MYLPDVPETLLEKLSLETDLDYAFAPQFIVRGAFVPDTSRCGWSELHFYYKDGKREPFRGSDTFTCVADFRVSEYMVGKGPALLTVRTYVDHGEGNGPVAIDEDGRPLEDGGTYITPSFEPLEFGQELILWIVLPANILFQTWGYVQYWHLERENGMIKVVDRYKKNYEPTRANLALLEYTLDDYRREVKKAHAEWVSSRGVSVASVRSTSFVTDANDEFLRAKLIELGAHDYPDIRVTSPPPVPGSRNKTPTATLTPAP